MSESETEEREFPVDPTSPDYIKKVRNYVFDKKGGPVTEIQKNFEKWFQEQILFPSLLKERGVVIDGDNGDSKARDRGSRKGSYTGLIERFLGKGVAELIPAFFGEGMEEGIKNLLSKLGPIAAVLIGWYYAEETFKDEITKKPKLPPILHSLVSVLQTLPLVFETGSTLMLTAIQVLQQGFNLLPSTDEIFDQLDIDAKDALIAGSGGLGLAYTTAKIIADEQIKNLHDPTRLIRNWELKKVPLPDDPVSILFPKLRWRK